MITKSAMELILWQSLSTFLLVGALTGIVVSLMLVYRPAMFESLNRAASRWISTRRMSRLADRTLNFEQWFYRHHQPLGMLAFFGACYVLVHFGLLFNRDFALHQLPAQLPVKLPTALLEGLLDSLVLAALTGATVSLLVGLALWLRPSVLRGVDGLGNQWLTLRRPTKFLDIPRDQVNEFVMRHTQRVGWLLFIGSIFLLLLVLRVLV